MSIDLVGVHRNWDETALPPAVQTRFAAALGVAGPRPAETCTIAGTLFAATGKRRGWRPLATPCGSLILFAGHIDNRHQLERELGIGPDSDGAIYAAGFAAWGDDIDLRAIGQFASIIVRPCGTIIQLSRSPIAAPPLHYWHDGERFIVASLGHAIFATGQVERRIDYQKIADSLYLNYSEGARSWFEDVRRLPAGYRAIVTRQDVALAAYYDLASLPEVRLKSDLEYQHAAAALLEEGVKAALDGFSRPAISLSGGYDSQTVAAFAVRCRPGQPLEAFTGVPEEEWDGLNPKGRFGDERPHVEALAALYPEIKPHWIDAAGLFFDHKLSALFLLAGGPPRNTANMHWIHEIYVRARASGCDVLLTADYGNPTFSFDGYGYLATLARRGKWLRLWRETGQAKPLLSRIREVVTQALLPFAPAWLYAALSKLAERLQPSRNVDPFATWSPINPDFARRMDVGQRSKAMGAHIYLPPQTSTRELRADWLTRGEQEGADIGQAFELLHGIEMRDPTSYRPLVEFCLGIPDDQYRRLGQSRWLATRIMEGLVPEMVRCETRKGKQAADWHLRMGRQRSELIAEIDRLSGDEKIAAMLNLAALRQALVDWPPETPFAAASYRLDLAVPRGLATARFIHFVEGQNN